MYAMLLSSVGFQREFLTKWLTLLQLYLLYLHQMTKDGVCITWCVDIVQFNWVRLILEISVFWVRLSCNIRPPARFYSFISCWEAKGHCRDYLVFIFIHCQLQCDQSMHCRYTKHCKKKICQQLHWLTESVSVSTATMCVVFYLDVKNFFCQKDAKLKGCDSFCWEIYWYICDMSVYMGDSAWKIGL